MFHFPAEVSLRRLGAYPSCECGLILGGGFQSFRGLGVDQGGALEQAAEIFFAGVMMFAAGEVLAGGGFVADFEPFKLDDAHVLIAAFPDLALLQFHGRK